MIALKVDMLQDRKIYYLRARPCIFQPGNFTGWGSGGVNKSDSNLQGIRQYLCDSNPLLTKQV